ncbi:MAG: hypothetical protein SP1CHLAM14_14450 [Chlamydiales bacterium]|nr:hypothetical protein [Chlamydiales bacterium]
MGSDQNDIDYPPNSTKSACDQFQDPQPDMAHDEAVNPQDSKENRHKKA